MKKLVAILFISVISSFAFTQESIEIPNTFTPNNDGVNDIFYIRSSGYNTLKCTIINRYGDVVYVFYGLNGNWDGYTPAGLPCTDGTYFVSVEATNEAGKTTFHQGTLQLFR
jgi:gliding motility-associated-like protein